MGLYLKLSLEVYFAEYNNLRIIKFLWLKVIFENVYKKHDKKDFARKKCKSM